MRIATWNIERLRHIKELDAIEGVCEEARADILVLTESDERVSLPFKHCFHTPTPQDTAFLNYSTPIRYKPTEHRVSIYTNYEVVRLHDTFDGNTALCVEMETELGSLLVYGTIMGVWGNRHLSYQEDLKQQTSDFRRLAADGHKLCICGDYNCSFSDNYYFTKAGREAVLQCFEETDIRLLTAGLPSAIDHISISENVINRYEMKIQEWNEDKSLSDHKGVMVDFR